MIYDDEFLPEFFQENKYYKGKLFLIFHSLIKYYEYFKLFYAIFIQLFYEFLVSKNENGKVKKIENDVDGSDGVENDVFFEKKTRYFILIDLIII